MNKKDNNQTEIEQLKKYINNLEKFKKMTDVDAKFKNSYYEYNGIKTAAESALRKNEETLEKLNEIIDYMKNRKEELTNIKPKKKSFFKEIIKKL